MTTDYSREEINQLTDAVLLEFGAKSCQYCQSVQGIILSELFKYPSIRHIQIEDGKGHKLGRTFMVKLWPTLIFMRNGLELKRLVRQFNAQEIELALMLINNKRS